MNAPTKPSSKPPPPHTQPKEGEHTVPAQPAKPAEPAKPGVPAHATPDRRDSK